MSHEFVETSSPSEPETTGPFDWQIPSLVGELRRLRTASLAARRRLGRPAKLPSRRTLIAVVERLTSCLFPHRLSSRQLSDESIDYFVGQALDTSFQELAEQVRLELELTVDAGEASAETNERAHAVVSAFGRELPEVRQLLETDIQAAYANDPAARTVDEVLVCYPGLIAILHHRLAHRLHRHGATLVSRIIADAARAVTGIDIHPAAQIDESFFIDHGTGVVIGETAQIGRRVRLYHGVTLGALLAPSEDRAPAARGVARHPIVEDDVVIYAGATILGRVTIGRGSIIGGNVWLTHNVPPGSRISQAAARHDEFHDGSGI